MAQIHPDFYTIQHLHQPATEGELILLDFLQKNLNMEFEIAEFNLQMQQNSD